MQCPSWVKVVAVSLFDGLVFALWSIKSRFTADLNRQASIKVNRLYLLFAVTEFCFLMCIEKCGFCYINKCDLSKCHSVTNHPLVATATCKAESAVTRDNALSCILCYLCPWGSYLVGYDSMLQTKMVLFF